MSCLAALAALEIRTFMNDREVPGDGFVVAVLCLELLAGSFRVVSMVSVDLPDLLVGAHNFSIVTMTNNRTASSPLTQCSI